jgi:hypothetical protein
MRLDTRRSWLDSFLSRKIKNSISRGFNIFEFKENDYFIFNTKEFQFLSFKSNAIRNFDDTTFRCFCWCRKFKQGFIKIRNKLLICRVRPLSQTEYTEKHLNVFEELFAP